MIYDYLFPILNYHPMKKFIKSKRKQDIDLHHEKIMTRIKTDFMSSNVYTSNDHPLVVALQSINAVTEDLYRAYILAQDQEIGVTNMLKWFNGYTNGKPLSHPYFFLDKAIPECILAVSFPESHDEVLNQYYNEHKNYWMSWTPVRVRYHAYTDMDYAPLSFRHGGEDRVAIDSGAINIIEVDLCLLYIQYRYWLKSPYSKWEDGTPKHIMNFLMNYPLVNAVESSMQVAYFNRVACFFTESHIPGNRQLDRRHAYINTYKYIDESIAEVMINYKKAGGFSFDKLVSNLPGIGDIDYGQHFDMHYIPIRNQNACLVAMSVVPLYLLWLKLVKELQLQKWNTNELAKFKYGYHKLMNGNVIMSNLKDIGPRVKEALNLLLEYSGK